MKQVTEKQMYVAELDYKSQTAKDGSPCKKHFYDELYSRVMSKVGRFSDTLKNPHDVISLSVSREKVRTTVETVSQSAGYKLPGQAEPQQDDVPVPEYEWNVICLTSKDYKDFTVGRVYTTKPAGDSGLMVIGNSGRWVMFNPHNEKGVSYFEEVAQFTAIPHDTKKKFVARCVGALDQDFIIGNSYAGYVTASGEHFLFNEEKGKVKYDAERNVIHIDGSGYHSPTYGFEIVE